MRRGESFLRDHVPIAGRVIPGKMIREDYPLYPPRATREAIANAICHRDYASHGGAVAIAMYDDHLEIINPGNFHFDFTPEMLTHPHASKPWNPIIADVFYRAGIIEQWGTGTLNIIDWCKENQNPIPKWEDKGGSVVVTFLPTLSFAEEERAQDRAQDLPSRAHDRAQDRGDEILKFCLHPRSSKEIMDMLDLKHRGKFYKLLKPLLEQGLLVMTLSDKPNSRNQRYFTNTEKFKD